MGMTFKEYIKEAIKTNSEASFLCENVKSKGIDETILHTIFGLNTEERELGQAYYELSDLMKHPGATEEDLKQKFLNIVEELGDIFWYIAIAMHHLNVEPQPSPDANPDVVMPAISEWLDKAKRTLFYGADFDVEGFKQFLIDVEGAVEILAKDIAGHDMPFDMSMIDKNDPVGSVLEANVKKLRARYGEKFDSKKALERDIEQEYKAMEE